MHHPKSYSETKLSSHSIQYNHINQLTCTFDGSPRRNRSKRSKFTKSLCPKARALIREMKTTRRSHSIKCATVFSKLNPRTVEIYNQRTLRMFIVYVYKMKRDDHTLTRFETDWREFAGFVLNVRFDAESVQIQCRFMNFDQQFCYLNII